MNPIFGWIDNPAAVQTVLSTMPRPLFGSDCPEASGLMDSLQGDQPVLLYKNFREITNGIDTPAGPQEIGDCVSWAYSSLANYMLAMQIYKRMKSGLITMTQARAFFEWIATEPIYAACRVDIGGQRGSYSDGAVGAWAIKALTDIGVITRGLVGDYTGKRAKDWGAKGIPQDLLSKAEAKIDGSGTSYHPKNHRAKSGSMVKSFKELATLVQNGYTVAVCSNQGFTMTRDNQGFCAPQGRWMHAMFFNATRFDRIGALCNQSWGKVTPSGPLALEQPTNSFWVDEKVVDYMLSQTDSFTATDLGEYEDAGDLFLKWEH